MAWTVWTENESDGYSIHDPAMPSCLPYLPRCAFFSPLFLPFNVQKNLAQWPLEIGYVYAFCGGASGTHLVPYEKEEP